MGRKPCCEKVGLKKGPWTADEDKKLVQFILNNGQCCWRAVPKLAGLLRCGKSCRLRWTNYLRPDVKRGLLSEQEEKMVIDLHAQLGNRWSKIASNLPGRTDNEIKNHWNTHIKKRLRKMGIDPLTHKPLPSSKPDDLPNPKADSSEAAHKVDGEGVIDDDDDTSILQNSTFATMDLVNEVNTTTNMNMNMNTDDFCVDEIPVIEPHEILLPASCDTSSTPSTSSSSSSYSSTFDDLLFSREINDMYNEMMIGGDIWNDDFNALDLFISNDDGVGDDQGSWIRF